jgi:hypothetical protein
MFNFNVNRQYSTPNCTQKVVKLARAVVLDSNLIMSDLKDSDGPIRFIKTSNRPIGTFFGPRNRAGSLASFAKSYLGYGIQMNKSTPNNNLRRK